MPTEFDSFSPLADRDYRDVMDKESVVNAWMLQETMIEAGFTPYRDEWWHFSDTDSYDVHTHKLKEGKCDNYEKY